MWVGTISSHDGCPGLSAKKAPWQGGHRGSQVRSRVWTRQDTRLWREAKEQPQTNGDASSGGQQGHRKSDFSGWSTVLHFSTSLSCWGGHVNAPSLWKLLVPVHSKHQDTVTSPSTAAGAHLRVTESARDAVLTQPHLRATAGLGPNHRSKASAAIR